MNEDDQQKRYRDQDERATQQRAAMLGLQYIDTRGFVEDAQLLPDMMSVEEMYRYKIVPLREENEQGEAQYMITTTTPQSFLRKLTEEFQANQESVSFFLISDSGFHDFMRRYDPPREVKYDDVKISRDGDNETLEAVSKTLDSVGSDKILDYLIDQSDRLGASDIHLETSKDEERIRLRIDGTLHPIATLTHEKYHVLISSLANRANLSTAATTGQTGHMQKESAREEGKLLNMRVETIPTAYGVDVVIRMFTFRAELLKIDRLGLDDDRKKPIEEVISHPHGMVMVVGPTGSGKSTTLYSILNELNDPSRKIITLEDPVEIALPGISQIPIDTNTQQTFADGLRSVLRLDPDVVMVGEIRDVDTAKTAIQASITGHLVLTTFHASSAAAAFSRMVDMIGQNPIFANAIQMVIAQRLVRCLDNETKRAYTPDEPTKRWIAKALEGLPSGYDVPDLNTIQLYAPGSSEDKPFGYDGRIMIMEELIVNDEIQKYIRGEFTDINVSAIEKTARENGMLTMLQDGVLKVLRGETTLEEINRVL